MSASTLSRDDPALVALEAAYAKLDLFPQSLWRTFADGIDIQNFRGEHAYLAQMWGGMTEQRYRNTYEYLIALGEGDTLWRLKEDDAFGCIVFPWDGMLISRDLLDSVCELQFLKETLGLNPFSNANTGILDIGAGYGRFAYRFGQAYPLSFTWCIDAVPLSTYLCDFYLKFRETKRAETIVLNSGIFSPGAQSFCDVAVNQYSFSEMPLAAIEFWLRSCADLNIRYFFLVPHAGDLVHPHFLTSEPNGDHRSYAHLFEIYGYREIRRRPKFPRERAAELIYSTDYLMFERKS